MAFLTRRYRDVLKIQGSSGQRYMQVRTSCTLQCELYADTQVESFVLISQQYWLEGHELYSCFLFP